MKYLIPLLFISLSYAKDESKIHVHAMNEDVDLTSLDSRYVKHKYIQKQGSSFPTAQQRDAMFYDAGLSSKLSIYDAVDLDIIFMTTAKQQIKDVFRKYPKLKTFRVEFQRLKTNLKDTQWQ